MSSRATALLLTLAIALVMAFAITPLMQGRAVPIWDANLCFAPYQTLIADFARHGELVLWNPWVLGGSPDFAEPQLGTLSPLFVIMGALTGGGLAGFVALWLMVWVLSAVGVQLLARSWGVAPTGAAIGALSYSFCGMFTGHAEHVSVLVTSAALPFVVWRFDAALRTGSRLAAAEAGAILGLGALGGYPGLVVQSGAFLAAWMLGRAVTFEHEARSRAERLRAGASLLAIAGLMALLVLAPSYVGFLREAEAHTERVSGLSVANALSNSLSVRALATFASPYVAELALFNRGLWGDNDVSSASIYMGPVVVVLALGAVPSGRGRFRFFLASAALGALLLSLGQALPFRRWLDELLPPFRYFRHPSMTRLFFAFSIVALALDALRPRTDEPRASMRPDVARLLFAVAASTVAVLTFRGAVLGAPDRGSDVPLAEAHYLSVWIATTVLTGLALVPAVRKRRAVLVTSTCLVAFVDAAFNGYLSRPIMLETDVGQRRIWAELERRHDASIELRSLDRGLLPKLGEGDHNLLVKRAVLGGYSAFTDALHSAWLESPVLRAAATGPDRIHFGATETILPVDEASFAKFVARAGELGGMPLVVAPKPTSGSEPAFSAVAIAAAPPVSPLAVTLERYSPRELVFRADAPSAGWLLVTDRWAPGWRATVNGHAVQVHRGAFLFRAVRVPSGRVRVAFSYEPLGLPWLVGVSWLTLAAVTALRVCAEVRTRHGGAKRLTSSHGFSVPSP